MQQIPGFRLGLIILALTLAWAIGVAVILGRVFSHNLTEGTCAKEPMHPACIVSAEALRKANQ